LQIHRLPFTVLTVLPFCRSAACRRSLPFFTWSTPACLLPFCAMPLLPLPAWIRTCLRILLPATWILPLPFLLLHLLCH